MSPEAGLELNDFAVFTTFGLASALLLGVDGPLNGFLAIIYVLTTSFRLCFYSAGEWNPIYLRSVAGVKGQEKPEVTCALLALGACWGFRAVLAKHWSGRHGSLPLSSCVSLVLSVMEHSFTPGPQIREAMLKRGQLPSVAFQGPFKVWAYLVEHLVPAVPQEPTQTQTSMASACG